MSTTTNTDGIPAQRSGGRIGRPPLTDAATILDAAREHGFNGLTVGRMASAVGVKYSTFYRHYRTIDDLVAALADDILERAVWPDTTAPWREHLDALAVTLTRLMQNHPGLHAALERLPARQTVTDVRGRAMQVLRAAGFDTRDAHDGVDALLTAATLNPERGMAPALITLTLDGLSTRITRGAGG